MGSCYKNSSSRAFLSFRPWQQQHKAWGKIHPTDTSSEPYINPSSNLELQKWSAVETSTTRDASLSPASGAIYYNSSDGCFYRVWPRHNSAPLPSPVFAPPGLGFGPWSFTEWVSAASGGSLSLSFLAVQTVEEAEDFISSPTPKKLFYSSAKLHEWTNQNIWAALWSSSSSSLPPQECYPNSSKGKIYQMLG